MEAESVQPSDLAELTIVVDVPGGTIARRVPAALPLPEGKDQGRAAEGVTRDTAALWGLPDFVFLPEMQRRGSGTREVGDGLIIAGDRAAVLQIKSRTSPSGDPAKEADWCSKHVKKGLDQGSGTIRTLRQQKRDFTNARGRRVTIDGTEHQWLSVVVVDHAAPPADHIPGLSISGVPAVVLLRRNWEFLFGQLRSTHAVLHYLGRVAGETTALGSEPSRYYDVALADATTTADPMTPQLHEDGVRVRSTPRAPLAPAGTDDLAAHMLLRILLEEVATTVLPVDQEQDRLRMLAAIDTLPVATRTDLGQTILRFDGLLTGHSEEHLRTESRSYLPSARAFSPLLFVVASQPYSEETKMVLDLRTHLFHYDYCHAIQGKDVLTVGILLTPSRHSGRRWDISTLALFGDQGHTVDDMDQVRAYVQDVRAD